MDDLLRKAATLEQLRVVKDSIPSLNKPLKSYEIDTYLDNTGGYISEDSELFLKDNIITQITDVPVRYVITEDFDFVHYDAGTAPVSDTDSSDSKVTLTPSISLPWGLSGTGDRCYVKNCSITIGEEKEILSVEYIPSNNSSSPYSGRYLMYSNNRDKEQYYLHLISTSDGLLEFRAKTWWTANDEITIRCRIEYYHKISEDSIDAATSTSLSVRNYNDLPDKLIFFNNNPILRNIDAPEQDTDAVNKKYIDDTISSSAATDEEFEEKMFCFTPEVLTIDTPTSFPSDHLSTISVKSSTADCEGILFFSIDNSEYIKKFPSNYRAVRVKKSKTWIYSLAVGAGTKYLTEVGSHIVSVYVQSIHGEKSHPITANVEVVASESTDAK